MEQLGRDAEGRIFVVIIRDMVPVRVVSDPVPTERTFAASKYISEATANDQTSLAAGENDPYPTETSPEASTL